MNQDGPPRRPWARRVALGAVVVGAVVWAALHRPSLSTLTDDPRQVAALATALAAANVVYVTGLVLAAAALARRAGASGRAWRAHASVRRWSDDLLARTHRDRWFRLGFALNGVGAVLAALVPAVAIVTLLPPAAWSLLVVSALDVGGAVALRVAVRRRLRRLAREVSGRPAILAARTGPGGD